MLGWGLISMEFQCKHVHNTPTLKERVFNFEHWDFFHIRVKTLKTTLRPNIEQNFDLRVFRFFTPGLKGTDPLKIFLSITTWPI